MDSTSDNAATRQLTFGERAVGLTFNPSNDDAVAACKRDYATVIDRLHEIRWDTANNKPRDISGEKARMIAVAITEAQTSQMWAVKALTWQD